MSQRPRYYMIGGFLGAGKTTAVAALAQHLTGRGLRVGLITNDQGSELVDTAMLRARGFQTEEIPGGCFCCRFNSLVEAAQKLTQSTQPDAFVAEPVGSCTDLMATVTYPLRRLYGQQFDLAPLSVLVDPLRAQQILNLRPGRTFSEKVRYIWRKQVEEAEVVVLAKCDLLDAVERAELREALQREFPGKPVLEVSVRTGSGVAEWFRLLEERSAGSRPVMDVDYDLYADGEALMGWLNATVHIQSGEPLDSSALLKFLAKSIAEALPQAEIAHLKMTFSPAAALGGEVAALSLVQNDIVPELTLSLDEPVTAGELIVNCRAEAAPDALRNALELAVAALARQFPGLTARLEHAEQFRPGRPNPTHRFAAPLGAPASV